MELIVKVTGATEAEILEGLEDAVALVQNGHTTLPAGQDPEGVVEFELRDNLGEGFCDSPWAHDECTHD